MNDACILSITDAQIKKQIKKSDTDKQQEGIIDYWINGEPIYRKIIKLTDPSLFQKNVVFKVCDLFDDFKMLIKGYGIIKTYENSYSNNDILVYVTNTEIKAKQDFTGYPQELYIVIEYIKK